MKFIPTVNHHGHVTAEKKLEELCKTNGWHIEDCQNYYNTLSQQETETLIQDFSEDALRLRSQPDKLVFIGSTMLAVDLKSTVRNDTGNIAIELSSYYFSSTLYNSLYAYITNNKLMFFSPKNNPPHTIITQNKWKNNTFFNRIIHELQTKNPHLRHITRNTTSGSGDPFILLDKKEIKHTTLTKNLT